MIRMALTDLDDTLLRSDRSISDFTVEVLGRCRAAGVLVGFCTARGEQNIAPYVERIHPDVVISSGGALARFRGGILHAVQFTQAETRALIDAGLSRGCEVTVDTLNGHYWNYAVDPLLAAPDWGETIRTDYSGFCQEALKVCIELPEPALAESIAGSIGGCDWVRFSGGNWYKFTRAGANKESAIRDVAERLGIPIPEVIAFGDDYGDIGMLKLCGTGVAVANAAPEVRKAADIVTDSNDCDGVANCLKRLLNL